MRQIVVCIGPGESSIDLVRRRPDLFRQGREGVEFVGGGDLTIVRQMNPPAQYPLSAPLDEAQALLARALRRCAGGA